MLILAFFGVKHLPSLQFQGGVWSLNLALCDGLMTMDVMLCTSSIFNLCAISVDRFGLLSYPWCCERVVWLCPKTVNICMIPEAFSLVRMHNQFIVFHFDLIRVAETVYAGSFLLCVRPTSFRITSWNNKTMQDKWKYDPDHTLAHFC